MLKILVGLLVTLLLLFVAADYVARSQAEQRAGKQLASSLDLQAEPKVELNGWPFLLKALGGELPSASFEADSVRSRGVTLEAVDVRVTGLAFEFKDILAGSKDAIKIEGGEGTAVLPEEELAKVLRREGIKAKVRLTGEGVLVDAPRLPKGIDGDLTLESGNLVVSAGGSALGTIRLPQIVDGLTYEDVSIEDGRAVLSFRLEAASLSAP